MKTILMAASALAMIAAPAFAQNAATLNLDASVTKACSSIGAFSSVIDLGVLPIDNEGYLANSTGDFVNIPNGDFGDMTDNAEVWCNAAATITISGTPLVHESLDQSDRGRVNDGFMRHIDLRIAGFNYGGISFGDDLNSGSGLDNATASQTRTANAAFAGEVQGQAQLWTGDYIYGQGRARPLGGAYTAVWTFTVSPNS